MGEYAQIDIEASTIQRVLVPEVWLFASEALDIWIDISSTLPRKIAARLAHASQHTNAQELERNWYLRAAEAGRVAGLAAAEAFKRVDLR